jgi:hypothetical protein
MTSYSVSPGFVVTPKCPVPVKFPNKIREFLISRIRAKCPAHQIAFDLITLIIPEGVYKL